jgi:hypothetical protein
MRRRLFLGLASGLASVSACGEIAVDDPFQNPISDGTTGGNPPAESSEGVDPTSTSSADSTSGEPPGLETSGGPAVCGDGMLGGDEICDGEDFGDSSCEAQGYTGGTLMCLESCQGLVTDGCYNCGNGLLEVAEQCDGPLAPSVTCVNAGFSEGTIACDPVTCQFDTSGCQLCGNGIAEGTEACDGDDLLGLGCADVGFDDGTLACNAAACSYDLSGCSGGQYIQDFEGGVVPPEFDSSGSAVWIVDSGNPIAGSWSAASGVITHLQTSNFTLAVNYAIAGTVAFTHEESSESSFDYLEFWVDGVMQQEWSGINAAQMASYPVAAGNHTFEWRYTKDGSVNSGSDRVWVDDIMLTGGVPTG